MNKKRSEHPASILGERAPHYVVDTGGETVAVLLTLDEYKHYLDLLEDEADSQDADLAARLRQVREGKDSERMTFRDYLRQRPLSNDEISR